MKQNKKEKKVVSDKAMKSAIKSFGLYDLVFENDIYNHWGDYNYFSIHYDSDFDGKSLPSKEHITSLILQDATFKKSLKNLVEHAAEVLISEFSYAKANVEDERKEIVEEAEHEAKRKKLLNTLSKEQITLFHEAFNITV
jgi:hypothetical protein